MIDGVADKEPLSQLNPKKKIFETIQPGFTTLGSTSRRNMAPTLPLGAGSGPGRDPGEEVVLGNLGVDE